MKQLGPWVLGKVSGPSCSTLYGGTTLLLVVIVRLGGDAH